MSAPGGRSGLALPGGQGTYSYSGDPANSDLDAVRFLIGDTNPGAYILSDEEINWLLALSEANDPNGKANVTQAAGAAAEAIAAELSREVSYSADGVSISADTLAAKFYTVAEKIRTLGLRSDVVAAPDVGGIIYGETYDDSLRPLVFSVGMHDNYLAGQQDFGGAYLPTAKDYQSRVYLGIANYTATLVNQAVALGVGMSANVVSNVTGPGIGAEHPGGAGP